MGLSMQTKRYLGNGLITMGKTRTWKLEVVINQGNDEWWETEPSHEELLEQVLEDLWYYYAKVTIVEYKERLTYESDT